MSTYKSLSVITPLYNEEESVQLLYSSITKSVQDLGINYEIIFVDDGSNDGTFNVCKQIAQQDKRLKVVKLRRNYGQTPAMVAGIDLASSEIIVTMDGDLQNDPADIPNLISKIKEGFDIVVGWRHKRKDKFVTRKMPSVIANWLIGKVTGVPIKDNGCSLKAYKSQVIKNVPLYSEMHRFIPAMLSLTGAKVAEIKVRHHARQFGTSKYGLSRIYRVVLDLLTVKMITAFYNRPFKWFSLLALPILLFAIAMLLLSVYLVLNPIGVTNIVFPGIFVILLSLAGFLVLVGALGELIQETGQRDIKKSFSLTLSQKI